MSSFTSYHVGLKRFPDDGAEGHTGRSNNYSHSQQRHGTVPEQESEIKHLQPVEWDGPRSSPQVFSRGFRDAAEESLRIWRKLERTKGNSSVI